MVSPTCLAVAHHEGTLDVELHRPERLNALCLRVFDELDDVLDLVDSDGSIRVLTLRGHGRAFCAGADVHELRAGTHEVRTWLERGQAVLARLDRLDIPVIAVVEGLALGGGFELMLACDLVMASTDAQFGLPEPSLGLIPGLGGTQRLPRAIGRFHAQRLLLTGATVGADDAWVMGLLSFPPVEPGEVTDRVRELTEMLGKRSAPALSSILELSVMDHDQTLGEGLRRETERAVLAVQSADGQEGIEALLAKRSPNFEEAVR